MLLEKIRADAEQARRAKDTFRATLLVTLFAEAARPGKDNGNRTSTDDEVMEVTRKFIKNINDALAVLPVGVARDNALAEKNLLSQYLPRVVSGEELKAAIEEVLATLPERNLKQRGPAMQALKAKLAGAYDGKEAADLVLKALST